jgi:hypothetical protein
MFQAILCLLAQRRRDGQEFFGAKTCGFQVFFAIQSGQSGEKRVFLDFWIA